MTNLDEQMLSLLTELKNDFGVIAVKAEFEAEGSRTEELVMLNRVVFRAGLNLIIKIGGCEAVRDLDQCRLLGADGIMAPMIETPFAMSKFRSVGERIYADRLGDIEWIINTETKTCLENLDDILETGKGFLNAIVIGRSDLSASMGLEHEKVNSPEMFEASVAFATKAHAYGLTVGIGGKLLPEAIPFIIEFAKYAERFETRKVVFRMIDDPVKMKAGIAKALRFETLYLENKRIYYARMAYEDEGRLNAFKSKLASFSE
jgi:hypothetical protein